MNTWLETAPRSPICLHTPRLMLRFLVEADISALFHIFSDPEVTRYWSSPPMVSMDHARQMLLNIQAGYRNADVLQLGLEHLIDQTLIGTCTLHHFNRQSRRAEIGYALGRPYWGHGYMHEALVALIDFAFGVLNLNRLEADIDPRNTASEKALLRLGFQKEGHLRERWIVNGEVSDTGFYGLLRKEWIQRDNSNNGR